MTETSRRITRSVSSFRPGSARHAVELASEPPAGHNLATPRMFGVAPVAPGSPFLLPRGCLLMSAQPPDAGTPGDDAGGGKRKGKVKLHHTVGKVVGATMVVIALVTGL